MGKLLQDFTHWKGNYKEIRFLIDDVASVEDATAVEWAMSETATSAALVTKKLSDSPATITLSGKYVTVKIAPADTNTASGIAAGTYYHELRLVDSAGNPSTPAIGTMTLKAVILTGV